jgi:hypothetical protein
MSDALPSLSSRIEDGDLALAEALAEANRLLALY